MYQGFDEAMIMHRGQRHTKEDTQDNAQFQTQQTLKRIHRGAQAPKREVIRMYEYEVMNRQTEEVMIIYGYNVANAFSRLAHLEKFATPNDWIVTNTTYID